MATLTWKLGGLAGLLAGLFFLVGPVEAQEEVHVHPKSQFWIEGEATTHTFTCVVSRVEGMGKLPSPQAASPASTSEDQTKVVVRVPVRAFECGNRRMTRDLQETLKMSEHPDIRFELVHASVGRAPDSSAQWRRIEALGTLTIAGTKRLIRLRAAGRAFDGHHFRLRGCKPIRMTYFGIEPPTKAFGLIRVKNRIEVQFDLLARAEDGEQPPARFQRLRLDDPPACDE